jgi:hypothetical protein
MNKLLLTLALVVMATFADAQGTIQFANNAGTRISFCGIRPTVAGQFTFGVFAGLTADALSSQPVGNLGTNTSISGLISSPNPQAHQLPGFAPGTTAFIQIRGWESRFGSDWQAGRFGGIYGDTAVRSFVLGPASGPGTVVWSSTDLTKFQGLLCIPEPSTGWLTGLAHAGLLLCIRRK